jgi:hypothetical protein
METPQPPPPQISVSGRIVIEGQLPAPRSAAPETEPELALPSPPPWWKAWTWPPEKLLGRATAFLALATFGLAVIAWIQLHHNDDTANRQLRAYVSVDGATVSHFGDTVVPPEAHVILKNSGQTPAYEIRGWIAMKMAEFPFNGTLENFGSLQSFPSVIGSGGSVHGIIATNRSLSTDENKSVSDGTGALFVWGEFTYQDAFKAPHYTRFRMFFGGSAGIRPDGLMMTTKDGNDAD